MRLSCDIICRGEKDRELPARGNGRNRNRFGIFRDGRVITIRDK